MNKRSGDEKPFGSEVLAKIQRRDRDKEEEFEILQEAFLILKKYQCLSVLCPCCGATTFTLKLAYDDVILKTCDSCERGKRNGTQPLRVKIQ